MDYIADVLVASGKPRDFVTFSSVYTMDVVWRSAVAQVLELQRETDVRLHLLHTHSHGSFITSDPARMKAIWEAINDGTIDTVDSDHAPHTLEDLERFKQDPWTGPFGSPQYDNRRRPRHRGFRPRADGQ